MASASPPAWGWVAIRFTAIGFVEALELFQADAETELIVLTGEIGGDDEERAAAFIAESVTKPVVGYIAGFEAPPGKRMGHAGAIVTGSSGTAAAKAEALEAVGAAVGRNPTERGRSGRGAPGVTEDAPPGRSGARPDAARTMGRAAVGGTACVRGARRRSAQLLGVAGFLLIGGYGLWSWAKIGLLTALLSLRADWSRRSHGRPMLPAAAGRSGTLHLRVRSDGADDRVPRGWRRAPAAARRGHGRAACLSSRPVLAAAGAAVPVAILAAVCSTLVTLSFPVFGLRLQVDVVERGALGRGPGGRRRGDRARTWKRPAVGRRRPRSEAG